MAENDASTNAETRAASPSGAVGRETAPTADRDRRGRFAPGNTLALVTGNRSAQFWRAADDARREMRAAVLADAGFGLDDAPRALRIAADGLAQAALLRDAAFARVLETGGPLTSTDRTRRSFSVWQAAADRVERYSRLIGLKRQPKPAPSLSELLASLEPVDEPTGGDGDGQGAEPNAEPIAVPAPDAPEYLAALDADAELEPAS